MKMMSEGQTVDSLAGDATSRKRATICVICYIHSTGVVRYRVVISNLVA